MNRTELIRFLTRCVRDGAINERRAAELLLAFDNGTLEPADLPQEQEDDDLIIVLPWVIATIVTLLRRLGYAVNPNRLIIPERAKAGLREALRVEFLTRSRALAAALARTGDVNAWQSRMGTLIKRNIVENAIVGAGRNLTAFELSEMTPIVGEQMVFLARFADSIALRNLTGKPMSFELIAARSELYGRMGISFNAFFNEIAAGYGPGWVVEYIALDDQGTCSACHGAQGLYLPTEGPMPGEICFGGMRCRCEREARFDPEAYAELIGGEAEAA